MQMYSSESHFGVNKICGMDMEVYACVQSYEFYVKIYFLGMLKLFVKIFTRIIWFHVFSKPGKLA